MGQSKTKIALVTTPLQWITGTLMTEFATRGPMLVILACSQSTQLVNWAVPIK